MNKIILFLVFLIPYIAICQNTSTCTEEWCYDEKGKIKEELRFNPNSIEWPLHFNSKKIKDESWILVRYKHHDIIETVSLSEYRSRIGDPSFCSEGVELNKAFECKIEESGKPKYKDASCSLLGISKEEKEIPIGENSCIKKIIDWTIIDWCVYDEKKGDNGKKDDLFYVKDLVYGSDYYSFNEQYGKLSRDGYYSYRQEIKVGDATQPTILHSEKHVVKLANDCTADIKIGNRGKDEGECPSNKLKWTVTLRGKNIPSKLLDHEVIGADSVEVKLEDLEAGEYQVLWRVKDACNNPQEEKSIIIVEDHSAPHIICKGGLSVGVGSPGHPVTISVNKLVKSITDNCTSESDIVLSFSEDKVQPNLDLTCEEYFGEAVFNIYASDLSGNQSYCEVRTTLSSNDPECMRSANFTGVLNSNKGPVSGAILIFQYGDQYQTVQTSSDGHFSFSEIIPLNADLTVALQDEVISGSVTTTDLVAIQKMAMNQQKADDMYMKTSADIDNDGRVGPNDVKLLRQYLLGILRYEDVLGNKLLDLDSGHSGKSLLLSTDNNGNLNLGVVLNGDVAQNFRKN